MLFVCCCRLNVVVSCLFEVRCVGCDVCRVVSFVVVLGCCRFVSCLLLFVVCGLLLVVLCSLFVRCVLCVACCFCLVCIVWCVLFVVSCLLCALCRWLSLMLCGEM